MKQSKLQKFLNLGNTCAWSETRDKKIRQLRDRNCLKINVVEIKRFELLTPCLQSRCSTN